MTFTSARTLICIALPLALTVGCQSHRAGYAYTPDYYSTPSTVTLSPTSDYYQTERVYSVPNETVVTTVSPAVTTTSPVVTRQAPLVLTEAPTGVPGESPTASDLVLAGEIRRMISQDNDLVVAARNTRISIYHGMVTITGTTATRNERERLHRAIGSVPGILKLDDRVRATLEGSY